MTPERLTGFWRRAGAQPARVMLAPMLLAAAALAGCAAGTARPTPAELPANMPAFGVGQLWSARTAPVDFPLQVSVNGTQLTLASGNGVVLSLDAATGRELSRVDVGTPISAGVGSDGRISAVVTRSNQVVALADGRELWRHTLKSQSFTAPLVAGGRVFVLGADRSLTGLDGQTGQVLWRVSRPAEPLVLRQSGVLLAVGETLVAGLAGRMVGVDALRGTVRWEVPVASARGTNDVERLVDLVGPVRRQGSMVCARSFQAAVGCVDAANGSLRWSKPANGATGVQGDAERVYGSEADGTLTAWRADTGDRAWSTDLLKWRYLTAPLVLGRSVVVGDSTGLVHLLSREDGRPLNRLTTDGAGLAAAPVVAADALVVVTRAGGVYAFAPQ